MSMKTKEDEKNLSKKDKFKQNLKIKINDLEDGLQSAAT